MASSKLVTTGGSKTIDQLEKDVSEEFEAVKLETPTPVRLHYRLILSDFLDAAKEIDSKTKVDSEVIAGVFDALSSVQKSRGVASSGGMTSCVPGWGQPPTEESSPQDSYENSVRSLRQWVDTFRYIVYSKNSVSQQSSVTARWTRKQDTGKDSLPAPRASHSMTTLYDSNGSISGYLVFGGFSRDSTGTFETYSNSFVLSLSKDDGNSPSWKEFSAQGEIPRARSGHTATRISDNEILVFGGCQQQPEDAKGYSTYFNDIILLNLSTRTWSTRFPYTPFVGVSGSIWQRVWNFGYIPPPESLDFPLSREGHTSDFIKSKNELFIFGGSFYSSDAHPRVMHDIWAFNLATNKWRMIQPKAVTSPNQARDWWPSIGVTGHNSCVIADRFIVYSSGSKFSAALWRYDSDAIIFDVQTEKWLTPKTRGESIPPKRGGASSCIVQLSDSTPVLVTYGGHYHCAVPTWVDQYYESVHVLDLLNLKWLNVKLDRGNEDRADKGKEKEEGGSGAGGVTPGERKRATLSLGEVVDGEDDEEGGKGGGCRLVLFGGGAAYRKEKKMVYYNDVYTLDLAFH